MTSDAFKNKKKGVDINYLITGPGTIRISFNSSLYTSVSEANEAAISRAINLAKGISGISLYQVSEFGSKIHIFESENRRIPHVPRSMERFFNPIGVGGSERFSY